MNAPRVAHVGRNGRRFACKSTHEGYGIPANLRIKAKAEIHSYQDCHAFLDGTNAKVVASNVAIVRVNQDSLAGRKVKGVGDAYAVRLYDTDIVTYYSDGTFSWTNGGFYTPTTSARAKQFGPKGVWFSNHKLKLYANGTCEGDGVRLPVPRDRL